MSFKGWLHKQPSSSKGDPVEDKYRLRFFVIDGKSLRYFKEEADFDKESDPLGIIPLASIKAVEVKDVDSMLIQISETKRLFVRAVNESTASGLSEALKQAGISVFVENE